MITLNNDNFVEFAVKHYSNPRCLSADEFFEDLNRFKYIKRLLNRYERTGVVQEKLVINHLISIFNVFDIPAATEMSYARTKESTWPALKTFLLFLDYVHPENRINIPIDKHIYKKLHKL